jgi:protein-tyrosine phosphatase
VDATVARSLDRVIDRDELVFPDHPDRRVAFAGAFNFRDLGGYRGVDGRQVRWRTLYRADALHRLDDTELDVLGGLGVKAVLDLRTANEIARGRLQADHLGIVHHHLPVLGETWAPAELDEDADASEVLGSLYVQMLDVGAPALAGSLRLLASAGSLPAVFHCAAGKDRTGVLAALVLALLGVDDEVIIEDYALTAQSMERLVERLTTESPESLTAMNDQPSAYLAAPAGAMAHFLGHVDQTHGSVAGYVQAIGVEDEVVDALRQTLLTPVR